VISIREEEAMPSLFLRDIPPELHKKLKERAERHHRSMTKEAVVILEKELWAEETLRLPKARRPKKPLKIQVVDEAIDEGRR
jgi:plasmid stability protein